MLRVTCPALDDELSGVNQDELVAKLEAHIKARHPNYVRKGEGVRAQAGTGSTFWGPWYVDTNCHQ